MRGAHLFCPNQHSCKPQRLYMLAHFVSRDAMDIEGLSERTLEQAMDHLSVLTPDQLYDITVDQWLSLEGFAQRRAQKIHDAVQRSKNRPLPNLLYALGIPNVGTRTARMLADTYGSMQALQSASEAELQNLKDVGPVVAKSIKAFFSDADQRAVLERLTDHGIHPVMDTKREVESQGSLAGESIVFTGTLRRMGRKQAQELSQNRGARIMDNVTRETTIARRGGKGGQQAEKSAGAGHTHIVRAGIL